MIYLIDSQLPPGLVGHLQTHGLNATHVSQCGLERASDREIWNYAKSQDCLIVSKDEDFVHLSGSDPSVRPWCGSDLVIAEILSSSPPLIPSFPLFCKKLLR